MLEWCSIVSLLFGYNRPHKKEEGGGAGCVEKNSLDRKSFLGN